MTLQATRQTPDKYPTARAGHLVRLPACQVAVGCLSGCRHEPKMLLQKHLRVLITVVSGVGCVKKVRRSELSEPSTPSARDAVVERSISTDQQGRVIGALGAGASTTFQPE